MIPGTSVIGSTLVLALVFEADLDAGFDVDALLDFFIFFVFSAMSCPRLPTRESATTPLVTRNRVIQASAFILKCKACALPSRTPHARRAGASTINSPVLYGLREALSTAS